MTNWEKSCVDALVTSPAAFALFKAKQKNKKHVDQYINTIWPYEIKKTDNSGRSITAGSSILIFDPIIRFLKDLLKQGESGYVDREYLFDKEYTARELYNAVKNISESKFKITRRSIGYIIFCSRNQRNIALNVRPNEGSGFLNEMSSVLSKTKADDEFYGITTDTNSDRRGTTEYVEKLIKDLSYINAKKSKYKRTYFGQNVGIEIEYEGIWQKYLEKKLNRSKYAISFNSGIDGGETDGSEYTSTSRLRENRLRINGHRGLSALHCLVEDMIKSRCSITNKSGMHYHIDLTHLTEDKRGIDALDNFKKFCIKNEIEKELAEIFEIKGDRIVLDVMYSLLRYPTEFQTIEWRMGTPTFNFTKLTIQILCAIHVTNVLFGSKKNIDVEYLKYLAEIYKQINS